MQLPPVVPPVPLELSPVLPGGSVMVCEVVQPMVARQKERDKTIRIDFINVIFRYLGRSLKVLADDIEQLNAINQIRNVIELVGFNHHRPG